MQTTIHTQTQPTPHTPDAEQVTRAIEKRAFATVATSSPAGRPHVAGVLYEAVDGVLYINTLKSSRKARNVLANSQVAVVVPIRRLPVGPPSTVQFQAQARVLDLDDPEIVALIAAGRLKSITGHNELEMPNGCFLRIPLPRRIVTYGLGMSLRRLIADPLGAGGVIETESAR